MIPKTKEAIIGEYTPMNEYPTYYHESNIEEMMDEYAQQEAMGFAKFVMNNCIQDLGDPDNERWAYFPQNASDCIEIKELTDSELYTLYQSQPPNK